MTKTNPKFRNGEFSGFETSDEIMEAIEDVVGYEFDLDDLENCPANRVWQDPTPEQIAAVEARAWKLADADTDTLIWGQATIKRPSVVWLSVITTNSGNADACVPADDEDWTDTDRNAVAELEEFAEQVGTYIQRTSYRLL